MNKYLFISYAREDWKFAQRINNDLCANQIQTWIDHIGIRSGENWPERIAIAINNCTAMLVILSPESIESRWVMRELAYADQKGKPIFPLLLRACKLPSDVELRIGNIQWASFIDGIYESNFEELILSINGIMGSEFRYPIKFDEKSITGLAKRISTGNRSIGKIDNHASAVKPPAVIKPLNLDFDEPILGNQPTGWFNSLGYVDRVSVDYDAKIVIKPDYAQGLCVLFQNPNANDSEFGSLMQRVPIGNMAGKHIKLVGELRLENVINWAGLWLRADGEEVPNLFFYNMADEQINGTLPWKTYSIEAHLPNESVWLNYGIVLAGPGKLWADNFRILILDSGLWKDLKDI